MSWSASTRISDGRTWTSTRCTASGSSATLPAASSAAITAANAELRATWFSHSLLWDSCTDIDVPWPRFVRASSGAIWLSYSAWPYSCTAASSDSRPVPV